MTRSLYQLLLRLLPRRRRDRFGAEMAAVFADQRRAAPHHTGGLGTPLLWMKETAGMVRFSLREWIARAQARIGRRRRREPNVPRGGSRLSTELRWAWRGARARGWRATFVVVLLGVALAVNTLLFSVADSLVFRRMPYRDPEQLIALRVTSPTTSRVSEFGATPDQLSLLRTRTSLFAAMNGYMPHRATFILGADSATQEVTAFVTPGLIEMLGWHPAWGRPLTEADALDTNTRVALVSERLARERFGDPASAVGRRLETSEEPLQIVGVMPRTFAFPGGGERVWRPLDYHRVSSGSMYTLARLAPGVTMDGVTAGLTGLSHSLAEARAIPPDGALRPAPLAAAAATADARQLLWLLLGAALCLLLIASANVASVELAFAMTRARTYAIQMAIGGSRAGLIRAAVLEGAWLIGGAAVAGVTLAWLTLDTLVSWLPEREIFMTANPVHLDARAFAFMTAVAAIAWLAASLPVAVFSSRRDVLDVLKIEGRTAAASRGSTRVRQALTALEIALAVLLLAGSGLSVRTYRALLGVDKGFESDGVATVDLTLPTTTYSVPGAMSAVIDQLDRKFQGRPDVRAFTRTTGFLDYGTTTTGHLEVDGAPPLAGEVDIVTRQVDDGFFRTLRPRLERGRFVESGDPPTNVVITDALARRLWPGADPVGRQFRTQSEAPWLTVIGIASHIRYSSETPLRTGFDRFVEIYSAKQPPVPRPAGTPPASPPITPAAAATPVRPNTPRPGATFMFLAYVVRMDSNARLPDLYRDIRSIDSRFRLTITPIDESYAKTFADKLLAARIVTGFGVLAFVIATAGIYGVMAFLVAGRTREIGVRMALGADRRDIGRLILGSGLRLVTAGAVIGLVGTAGASHWIRAQLYGVSAVDPITYACVAFSVIATALVATWYPARQAASVDPAVTLRAE